MSVSEKDKMLQGVLYDANFDKTLLEERAKCKDLCFEFNNLRPTDAENQNAVLARLLGKTGANISVIAPFYCDYGYNIETGGGFFANHNCIILDAAKVVFGENVFIGPNCCFTTASHPLDAERRNAGLEFAHPITVGNNVWFGMGVSVMPGVTIGDGAVIGAGSVVTKDVPPGVVAVGNPCRVLREIGEEDKKKSFRWKK